MGQDQKIKLAENLSRLMTKRNLTVTLAAKKIGMNKSTLHNYCNGVVPRNLPKLKELADLLEVSLTELLFGSNGETLKADFNQGIEGRYEIIIRKVDELAKGDGKR